MKVLIACEESQAVCIAFRKRGFEAYSCDLQDCSGGHPEWHIKGDALKEAYSGKYDLMIAHPPCTYLSFAGNAWFNLEKYGDKAIERMQLRDEAEEFFLKLFNSPVEYICIENPRGSIMRRIPYSQAIHPYYFGNSYTKHTLLWLKSLPLLKHYHESDLFNEQTHVNKGVVTKSGSEYLFGIHTLRMTREERSRWRSKTAHGIAEAMASQWGDFLVGKYGLKVINNFYQKP